jgi:FHA domain
MNSDTQDQASMDPAQAVDPASAGDAQPTGIVAEDAAPATTDAESAVAMPRLIVKRGGVETEEIFFLTPPAVIGRFDPSVGPVDVDLGNIPEGSYVSRKHARIIFDGTTYSIHDLGSSNGTFVLGASDFERVDEHPLTDGLEFALGNARFVFRIH